MSRVPPSERVRKEVEELLRNGIQGEGGQLTSKLVKLGAQQLIQELLEQEVRIFLAGGIMNVGLKVKT